jgi:hypothetical protein
VPRVVTPDSTSYDMVTFTIQHVDTRHSQGAQDEQEDELDHCIGGRHKLTVMPRLLLEEPHLLVGVLSSSSSSCS